MSCTVEGCAKAARSRRGAYCEMHYYRLRRNGTLTAQRAWHRLGTCTIDGCARPEYRDGLCGQHDYRVRTHGDPSGFTPQRDRNLPRGEAHRGWTGDNATYEAAHQRVAAANGSARGYQCVDCGKAARHWSYNHDDPNERVNDRGYSYSVDAAFYSPRCVRCHKRFDLARIAGGAA